MASRSLLFLVSMILLAFSGVVDAKKQLDREKLKEHAGVTRESIVENHSRRKAQIGKLLEEAREKVADHESGRRKLEEEEFALFTKRVGLYDRKLEKMSEPLDEREIQRMLQREQMRSERYHREL